MTDHNYCDIEAPNSPNSELTESSSYIYDLITVSDDPDYEEEPNSEPQTRLTTKNLLDQTQPTWTPVRTAPGLRPNCLIFYDGNGFAYHNHKIANNKKYLKCTQKSIKMKPCPARAVIRNYDNMIRHSGELHTHKPRNYEEDLLKRKFLMIIRERAITETTSNRQIFDEEIKKIPELKGKVCFSSTARRMQRFRQPQKIQGPLFPIEDNELIDAMNDCKNTPEDDPKCSITTVDIRQNIKKDNTFDATDHIEVIEFDDDSYMRNDDFIDEKKSFNDKDNSGNMFPKETEKTVNMFCCIYCNKWQEPQLFEFLPNQTTKTIELKVEKPALNSPPIKSSPLKSPTLKSSPLKSPPLKSSPPKTPPLKSSPLKSPTLKSSPLKSPPLKSPPLKSLPPLKSSPLKSPPLKSLPPKSPTLKSPTLKSSPLKSSPLKSPPLKSPPLKSPPLDQTSVESIPNTSKMNDDEFQIEDTNDLSNLDDSKTDEDTISLTETDNPEISQSIESPYQEDIKPSKTKVNFTQMRIDSRVYFDNMGYSYQIQNEKNDKKYLRCVVWGKKKCPGRAHLNKKTLNITRSRGHNHLPSTTCDSEKQARAFLQSIKGRAQNETTALRTIYEDEIKKFPLAASVVNYVNATRRMQRTRRIKNQPAALELQKDKQLLLSVQVIPGTRRGTSLYLDELGFYYHNDTLTTSGKIVRCTKNRKTITEGPCHSRGFLRSSGDGYVIFRTKEHNHPPGNLKRNPKERSFINTLCERARTDLNLTLKEIYNQEVGKFLDVADRIPYRMAWRSMARIRQPPKTNGEVTLVGVSLVSGIWQGYTLYKDDKGFLYSMRKGRRFVWCHMNTKLKCLVKGTISKRNNVLMLEYSGEHNHASLNDDEFQATIFIEKILLKCLNDDSKPKKLYDEELVNFPGVEKRISLSYAREKIKARRKSLKKNLPPETLEKSSEPLQLLEFWGDDQNPIVKDEYAEDTSYSEDEETTNSNIYSNEQGFKYTVVDVKNKTRYLKCIKRDSGCEAQGEMYRSKLKEWLFYFYNNTHNHQPDVD